MFCLAYLEQHVLDCRASCEWILLILYEHLDGVKSISTQTLPDEGELIDSRAGGPAIDCSLQDTIQKYIRLALIGSFHRAPVDIRAPEGEFHARSAFGRGFRLAFIVGAIGSIRPGSRIFRLCPEASDLAGSARFDRIRGFEERGVVVHLARIHGDCLT